MPGCTVKWSNPIVMTPSTSCVAQSEQILGEIAKLDTWNLLQRTKLYRTWNWHSLGPELAVGSNTPAKLKVLNYKKVMQSPDAEEWCKEIQNEKAQLNKYNALTPVSWSSPPKGSIVLTTAWVMKMESNGTHRGRLNAQEYKQVDGIHCASDSIATPVTNPITVWIVIMLYCMNPIWTSAIINVEDTFLHRWFENGKELHVKVSDDFKEWYPGDIVLCMNDHCMVPRRWHIDFSRHLQRIQRIWPPHNQRQIHFCDLLGLIMQWSSLWRRLMTSWFLDPHDWLKEFNRI